MLSVPANRALPRRVDSLVASKGPYFIEVEEELRDIKRVNSQGQEEDLKLALGRMICRVEELTSLLKEAFKTQTEMQTELTLAKSNLQLALANNEMLEDALKRDASNSARDIGWRRWSAKEQKEREAEEERRRSVDSAGSLDLAHSQKSPVPSHANSPSITSPLPRSASVFSPAPSDGRFFRFRFGNGSATSATFPTSPRLNGTSTSVSLSASGNQSPNVATAHLTSASLPSLVPPHEREKEVEALTEQLKREREARKKAAAAKDTLEAELESLSQALFEEANKMVATERRKLAETEDELREACAEREALRSALRLVERQSGIVDQTGESAPPSALSRIHMRTRSSSSAMAIKSLPSSGPPSPVSEEGEEGEEEQEEALDSAKNPTSADTVIAAPRPPPLNLVEPDSPLFASPSPEEKRLVSHPDALGIHHPASAVPHSPAVHPVRASSPAPSLTVPGQFLLSPSAPMDYLVAEESPWADVESKAPQPVTAST